MEFLMTLWEQVAGSTFSDWLRGLGTLAIVWIVWRYARSQERISQDLADDLKANSSESLQTVLRHAEQFWSISAFQSAARKSKPPGPNGEHRETDV